ncbi:MAG: tRNA pseudouridine(55) synthase TruB [Flavobacteriales bacterium]|nr:tRNA pseudouridine(55) synthase TruB [Flavobacteriales bacterium]
MIHFNEGYTISIDKPLGWTSFQVVKKIKYLTKVKKVGHAGTLDPLATGLLIICTGKNTKKINDFQAQPKEYTGSFTIGHTTPSFDLETEPENEKPIDSINIETLQTVAENFVGDIMQIPPIFSAVKIKGERAYEKARRGEDVVIEAKPIKIMQFEIEAFEPPIVKFKIACSKGTYIRSIARDFGEALGCGAYLSELRRTKIGDFSVEEAYSVQRFEEFINTLKQG